MSILYYTQGTRISMACKQAYEAIELNDWDAAKEMLNKGELTAADINRRHEVRQYATHQVAMNDWLGLAWSYQFNCDEQLSSSVLFGKNLLTYAAEQGQAVIVEQLLLAGADIDSTTKVIHTIGKGSHGAQYTISVKILFTAIVSNLPRL